MLQQTLDSIAVADAPRATRVRRLRVVPSTSIAVQLAVLEVLIVSAVLVIVRFANAAFPGARAVLMLAVASALAIYALGGIAEAIAAVRAPTLPPMTRRPLPATTAIIAAYLPNEASIILETVAHHLSAGPADLQIIVAYNTPEPLRVEADLASLAAREPRLFVLKVEHSRSKAENVNAALAVATGEVVGVFDSDHHPAEGSYDRAWRWLESEADVVQGRCAVRQMPGTRSLVSSLVAAEFEQMYAVCHPGRARVQGFGLFGGSNGFWRADALRAIKFDPTALTEDIDASIRLLRSGGRIVPDPGIVSYELPPPTMRALCKQRLRWAQGWFQVRRRHLAPVVGDHTIGLRQRVGAFWVFGVGSILPWVGALVLPLTIGRWLEHDASAHSHTTGVLLAFGTAALLLQVVVAYRHALPASRRAKLFALYLVANAIFYAYLRVALVRLSHVHELMGRSTWYITPRS